ncbi:MAG: hypothetical protein LKI42_01525 [Bacteroidales bacterium]|jgi:hypothetical protein|nr:hypothetical protein [Bacteroidales bacterium]MCI1784956.1 hypothetical protein [Bacteroidales bacterium]
MKYFIRAVKYFFYFFILLAIIMAILVLIKAVPGNINEMFNKGYKSVWEIAIFFAVISAVYPIFSYVKKKAYAPGEFDTIHQKTIDYMSGRGYKLETEEGEDMTFRLKPFFYRLTRMFEDRLTFKKIDDGFEIEGPNKDTVRIIRGLEYALRSNDNDGDTNRDIANE